MPSSWAPGPREHAESCGPEECSGCAQHPHTSLRSTGHEGFRACLHHPLDNPWGDPSQELGPKSRAEGSGMHPQGRESRGKGRQGKGHRHQRCRYRRSRGSQPALTR